jgi:hypothetical protein
MIDPARELLLAAQAVAKYAGFVVVDHFTRNGLR